MSRESAMAERVAHVTCAASLYELVREDASLEREGGRPSTSASSSVVGSRSDWYRAAAADEPP